VQSENAFWDVLELSLKYIIGIISGRSSETPINITLTNLENSSGSIAFSTGWRMIDE